MNDSIDVEEVKEWYVDFTDHMHKIKSAGHHL